MIIWLVYYKYHKDYYCVWKSIIRVKENIKPNDKIFHWWRLACSSSYSYTCSREGKTHDSWVLRQGGTKRWDFFFMSLFPVYFEDFLFCCFLLWLSAPFILLSYFFFWHFLLCVFKSMLFCSWQQTKLCWYTFVPAFSVS